MGQNIPIVWGVAKFSTNAVWARKQTQKVKKKKTGKGTKSSTKTYTYTGSAQYLLCRGPIIGISRVWISGKLYFNILPSVNQKTYNASIAWRNKNATFYLGTETQNPDAHLQQHIGVNKTSAHRGYAYMVLKDFNVTDYGGRYPDITVEVVQKGYYDSNGRLVPSSVTVAEIVENAISLIQFPTVAVDTSETAGMELNGYVITGSTDIKSILNNLAQTFHLTTTERDNKIILRRKDRPMVSSAISSYPAFVDGSRGGDYEIKRIDQVQIPSEISVSCLGVEKDYEKISVSARIPRNYGETNVNNLDLPMLLSSDFAQNLATTLLRETQLNRTTYKFNLPGSYSYLEPGDIVTATIKGKTKQLQIQKISIGQDYVINFECAEYESTIYYNRTTDG